MSQRNSNANGTPTRAAEDRTLAARVVATYPLAGVSAGSALLRIGDRLLAVHDDAFRVTWIALPSLELTPLVFQGDGAALEKPRKPDFEAAVRTPDGAIHVLGSGSTPRRCTLARIDLATSAVSLRARPDLYQSVQDALEITGRPNIEGAIVCGSGERLRLFHRGGAAAPSATADVALDVLDGGPARVLATRTFELGELDGIRLAFTDAAAVADHRTIYVAAAEDSADAIVDGPVIGSAIGVIDDGGSRTIASWTRFVGRGGAPDRRKVEGVAVDGDLRGAWILTDADDPGRPAELGRVELRGFG